MGIHHNNKKPNRAAKNSNPAKAHFIISFLPVSTSNLFVAIINNLAGGGLEPPTSGFGDRCSTN